MGITALVYGGIEGGADSFTATKVVAALVLGVVAPAAFVLVERRSESPMLDLAVFRSAAFTASALVAMIAFLAVIGFFFVLSLYFGMVQQLSTLEAASRLLLAPAAAIVAGVPAGRLKHRVPARWMITAGLLPIAGPLLAMTTLDADTSYGSVAWRLIVLGVGIGVVTTPMPPPSPPCRTTCRAWPRPPATPSAISAARWARPSLSTQAVHTLPRHLAEAGVTGTQAHDIVSTAKGGGLGAVAGMNLGSTAGQVYGALGDSLIDGLRLCLVVATVLTLFAALCAVILLRRPKRTASGTPRHRRPARQAHPAASAENAQAAGTVQPLAHRRG